MSQIYLFKNQSGFEKDAWMEWQPDPFADHPRADSLFSWRDLQSGGNLTRVEQWARLLSSVGINGLNPVDFNWQHSSNLLLHLPETVVLAKLLAKYNIQLYW